MKLQSTSAIISNELDTQKQLISEQIQKAENDIKNTEQELYKLQQRLMVLNTEILRVSQPYDQQIQQLQFFGLFRSSNNYFSGGSNYRVMKYYGLKVGYVSVIFLYALLFAL